jgi:hypothetical protein
MNKEFIMKHWECDWDDDQMYYIIDCNGLITKINIETGKVYMYKINEAVH